MRSGSRDRILASIELALGFPVRDKKIFDSRKPELEVPWESPQRPWEDFQKEFEALSGRFHRAEQIGEVWGVVKAVLEENHVKSAVIWQHPLLEKLGIEGMLRDNGVEVIASSDRTEFLAGTARADLGITAVDALLEASGTIFKTAKRGRERAVSLVPPVHLAIATADQRLKSVRDLLPLWRRYLNEGNLPGVMSLISGPSRTADIELSLVLGAHGPRAVHLLALDPETVPSES